MAFDTELKLWPRKADIGPKQMPQICLPLALPGASSQGTEAAIELYSPKRREAHDEMWMQVRLAVR